MGQKLNNAINLYMEGINDGNYVEAVNKYTGTRYTQHSTGVEDGKEGFIKFFKEFTKRNPKRKIEIIRGWEDGQHVFLQALQTINDGETMWVTTDFFDTSDDTKIIEHWDVISAYSDQTPSGHTTIDGETKIVDLEKTDQNKEVVRNFLTDIFINKKFENLNKYISGEKYIQHNKDAHDGREELKNLLSVKDMPLSYQEIVLLTGSGNFVSTLSKATWEGKPYAQVDIFRVENGLIVEHWDNVEPVPPQEEWANSGKF